MAVKVGIPFRAWVLVAFVAGAVLSAFRRDMTTLQVGVVAAFLGQGLGLLTGCCWVRSPSR